MMARPVFTSRHYEAIAKLVYDLPHGIQWVSGEGWVPLVRLEDLTDALIAEFGSDNPGFKPGKFLKACGR
jgi:hypothetical protein